MTNIRHSVLHHYSMVSTYMRGYCLQPSFLLNISSSRDALDIIEFCQKYKFFASKMFIFVELKIQSRFVISRWSDAVRVIIYFSREQETSLQGLSLFLFMIRCGRLIGECAAMLFMPDELWPIHWVQLLRLLASNHLSKSVFYSPKELEQRDHCLHCLKRFIKSIALSVNFPFPPKKFESLQNLLLLLKHPFHAWEKQFNLCQIAFPKLENIFNTQVNT